MNPGSVRRWAAALSSSTVLWGLLSGAAALADPARGPRLLLLDIDGTQIRNRGGVHHRPSAERLIQRLAGQQGFHAGYITGRSFQVAEQRLGAAGFPLGHYDFKITRGGVEVRHTSGTVLPQWLRRVQSAGWDPAALDRQLDHLLGNLGPAVERTTGIHGYFRRGVIVHPSAVESGQSIAQFIDKELVGPLTQELSVLHAGPAGDFRRLGPDHGKAVGTVVHKSTSVPGSVYVDFVPTVAGRPLDKLAAMRWLVEQLDVAPGETIFAGDGTNDPLLRAAEAGFKVIAVGNTDPALKQRLKQQPYDNLYVAKETHAAGVLEGLAYFEGSGW